MHARDWFLVLVAIFFPPIAVWLKRGFFTKDLLINVLLCLLGFIPGLIHALYVVSQHPFQGPDEEGLTHSVNNYGSTA